MTGDAGLSSELVGIDGLAALVNGMLGQELMVRVVHEGKCVKIPRAAAVILTEAYANSKQNRPYGPLQKTGRQGRFMGTGEQATEYLRNYLPEQGLLVMMNGNSRPTEAALNAIYDTVPDDGSFGC